jgi:hypothetical protein
MSTFKAKLLVQLIAVEINDAGEIANEHVLGAEQIMHPWGLGVEAFVARKMAEIQSQEKTEKGQGS